MPLLKTRGRLVTFRLSGDEYEDLKRACVAAGSRSISDFSREAILHRVRTGSAAQVSLGDDLAAVGAGLEELNGALKALSGRITRVLGAARDTAHPGDA